MSRPPLWRIGALATAAVLAAAGTASAATSVSPGSLSVKNGSSGSSTLTFDVPVPSPQPPPAAADVEIAIDTTGSMGSGIAQAKADATALVTGLNAALTGTAQFSVVEFRDSWIAHLSRELRKVRAHAERLSLKTAQERIRHFIETEGERGLLKLNQSKKDWAGELGLTHEALYRALAQMEKHGKLIVEQSRLTLL